MDLSTAKSLIEGAVIGLNAYIKPGGIHRYAPGTLFDEILCNLISLIDSLVEAIDLGNKVRRGELAVTNIPCKEIIINPLKEIFRTCNTVYPQYVIPLVVGGVALGLSGVESILEESSKFKKALELVVASGSWSDIKNFIESLRVVGRQDMYDHLRSLGYVDVAALRSAMNLNEIYRVLGSRWRGFLVVETQEGLLFTYLKRLQEIYKKERSLFHSVIALYMELLKPNIPAQLLDKVKSAEQCGYMKTPECAKITYELDLALRKSKVLFNDVSEVVVLIAAFGSFEGIK
jgi:hypothetical protein